MSAPDPQLLHDLNLDALVYTGSARPTQEWVNHCRELGIIVTFIQETVSTRSQQGFDAGVYDCQYAEARAKELGHTGSIAYVVSDGSWSDVWDASEYGRGVQSVATLPFFSYGAVPICESFNRGAPRSLGTWVPETWGVGTLLTQVVGSSPVADTDLNHVHADYTGTPAPAPIPKKEESDMYIALLLGLDGVTNLAMLVDGGFMDEDFGTARQDDFLHIPEPAWEWVNRSAQNKDVQFYTVSVKGWDAVRTRTKKLG